MRQGRRPRFLEDRIPECRRRGAENCGRGLRDQGRQISSDHLSKRSRQDDRSITSTACEWKQPFKEGKTTLEAKFNDEKGEESNATITIEGKDGKITCLMKEKEKPDRIIRMTIVKFEEQTTDSKF